MPEPTVQRCVEVGADIIAFSGDKLLGGPQSGIVVGRGSLVVQLRRHPLTRALRVDKTTLAGLHATLLHYLRGEAAEQIPVWRMMSMSLGHIQSLAEDWVSQLREAGIPATVREGHSTVGGGSLPGQELPTALVAVEASSPDLLAVRLRSEDPAVISRISDGCLLLDPRTVQPEERALLLEAVRRVWQAAA
jgi:L-seryl-tRNA(Ser) seleniumtransferase